MKTALKVLAACGVAGALAGVAILIFPDFVFGILWGCAYAAGVYTGTKWGKWS